MLIHRAVRGMIPKNRLGRVLLTKLKVYKRRQTPARRATTRHNSKSRTSFYFVMADTKTSEFLGTGRRKTSVARVRLSSGSGKVTVNGRTFENYFPTDSLRMVVQQPFVVTNMTDKFDVRVNVSGGGPCGYRPARCAMVFPDRAVCMRTPLSVLR